MKKLAVSLLGMICALNLAACGQGESNAAAPSDLTPAAHEQQEPSQGSDQQMTVYNTLEHVQVALSAEDAQAIGAIFCSGEWINDITKCASDYEFVMDSGETYCYHSDCGTINDVEQERSFTVTDEQRDQINQLLTQAAAGQAKFGDKLIDAANLSEETRQWLAWYNSLPEEEQLAVSAIPADLLEESGISAGEDAQAAAG